MALCRPSLLHSPRIVMKLPELNSRQGVGNRRIDQIPCALALPPACGGACW